MRILIATSQLGVVGGIETHLRALLPALRQRGHELALLYEAFGSVGPRVDDGVPGVHAFRARKGAPEEAGRWAESWQPDVCYVHGLASPATEGRLMRVAPTVLYAHAYYGTCLSLTKRHAFPGPAPCRRKFGAACLALYLPCRCGGLDPRTMVRLYRVQRERHVLLARFAGVAVASEHMRQEYLRHGVPAERLSLLPLFPPGQVPDEAPPAKRPGEGRVLMIGRLTAIKGGPLLVYALREASATLGRPLTLVLAGDGPEREPIRALAGRLGVPVEEHGWVDPARRAALFRGADLLAVPSVWPEPFGLVGIEAGCVGLPAVAFATGGIGDWLLPGESGEAAPGDRPTAAGLAAALVRALRDPHHLGRLGEGAWRVAGRFTADGHLGRLEAILSGAARG